MEVVSPIPLPLPLPESLLATMNILCIHQNFPGQYKHLAPVLAQQGHRVVGLGETRQRPNLPRVEQLSYHPPQPAAATTHHYLQGFEAHVRRGQQVVRALQQLQRTGFSPDLILAHPGWGEALYLKDMYPRVPLVGLFEFYYRSQGGDVGFDPEFPSDLDRYCRARTRNAHLLIALEAVDWGVCPTAYQRSVHPEVFHPKLRVIHDGIDTDLACPNPTVSLTLHQPLACIIHEACQKAVTWPPMSQLQQTLSINVPVLATT